MVWTAAALLAAALALLGQWDMLPTADVSWLLYAAGRVLDGARIGRDVVDVNLPLVILDKLPAVAVARGAGLDPWHVWVACLAVLLAAALLIAARVPGSWFATPLHTALAAFALLAAPRSDFGQREHVAVIAVLPYLVLAGARLDRRAVPAGLAVTAGALAVPGLALKPFFVAVPVAVALLEWRRGLPLAGLMRLPEHGVVAAGVPLLWLAQFAAAPEWLAAARWYWPLYSQYGGGPPVQLGVLATGVLTIVAVVLLAFVVRRRWPEHYLDGEGEALLTGALGFFACIVVQARSLSYHFVPVVTLLAVLGLRTLTGRARPTLLALPVAVVLAMVLLPAPLDAVRLLGGAALPRGQQDPSLPALQQALRAGTPARRIAVLSTNPASVFPLVPSLGAESAWRQISLWPIIGLNAPAVYGEAVVTCAEPSAWTPLEQHWRDEVAEDFL
ncbi:MAG TPA: hypothetical protein VFY20_07815, partial [Gemmatimonadales bacterium]|nr:hypothetical protein [Gemmatimonadales bacterium]